MKVSVSQTVEVSDEQLIQMANVADGKKNRRRVKRTEARAYVWAHGADWETKLKEEWDEAFGDPDPVSSLI